MADHIKFPGSPSSEVSEGQKRFDEFERYLMFNWSTTMARPNLWYIQFDSVPMALNYMNKSNVLNKEGPNEYDQLDENQLNLFSAMEERIGCMLVHGITLPEIQVEAGRDQTRLGGYYGGMTSSTIQEQGQITVEFRETQSSVLEFVIRPWLELVAKAGLVARKWDDPRYVKTDITVINLGIAGPGTDPVKRKRWRFYDAVPISVANHRLTHEGDFTAQDSFIATNWAYSKYTVQDIQTDNMSALYQSHIQSDAMPPDSAARFADRVGKDGAPATPWPAR